MPSLSGKFDINLGPLINISVAKAGTISTATLETMTLFPALIDTGATSTCISPAVAQAIGLQPIGKRPMTSATHSIAVNVYLADLVLPFGNAGLVLGSTEVMEFNQPSGGPFQMLVGRDIICKGVFSMSFDGHFTFSL